MSTHLRIASIHLCSMGYFNNIQVGCSKTDYGTYGKWHIILNHNMFLIVGSTGSLTHITFFNILNLDRNIIFKRMK